MHPIFVYMLKSNLLIIVFWLFYRLFLRKETFYTPIRWYFIGSILISLIFPLITYTKTVIIEQKSVAEIVDFVPDLSSNEAFFPPIEPSFWETIDWQNIILWLIAIISFLFVLKSVYQIVVLYVKIRKLPFYDKDKSVKLTSNQQNVYSFFRWIVVPESKMSCSDLTLILAHEKIHLHQKHTFDLLLIELISAVFWFNPVIKMLQKDINTNLEFIVDDKMVTDYERIAYQKALLNEQKMSSPIYINAFSTSDLKKRIIQLNTQKSKSMKQLKFLLTAPALVAFFALFQVETVAQIKTIEAKERTENEDGSITIKYNFTAENLKADRKIYDALIEEFPVSIDDVPQTKEQLEKFDNTKIQSVNLVIMRNRDNDIAYNISTKSLKYDEKEIAIKKAEAERLAQENYVENISTTTIDENGVFIQNPAAGINISGESKELFIVDGKEITLEKFKEIDPKNIESITVLNQPVQVKPYGEKGKNGVMLIKTKSYKLSMLDEKERNRKMILEERRAEAEKRRKELIARRKELIAERKEKIQEAHERRKKMEEMRKEQSERAQVESFSEKFDLLESIFDELETTKEELESETVNITHISAKMFFPEEGMEMEMSRDY